MIAGKSCERRKVQWPFGIVETSPRSSGDVAARTLYNVQSIRPQNPIYGLLIWNNFFALFDIQVFTVELPCEPVTVINMKLTPVDFYVLPDNKVLWPEAFKPAETEKLPLFALNHRVCV